MEPRACNQGQGGLSRVTVVTHSPSPYQVELFDAVEKLRCLNLTVIYLHGKDPLRQWQSQALGHHGVMLTQPGVNPHEALEHADNADLVVINYYKHSFARLVMRNRAKTSGAMCFWGERPQRTVLPRLSNFVREWRLRSLLRSRAHVWGIGSMAVDAYRREFGARHTYVNLPYFSDLRRFAEAPRKARDEKQVFLFSGALSHRKGVDLLSGAFARVAREYPAAHLRVMGCGEMEPLMRRKLQGCMGRVEFLGFREWNDLHVEYAQADILCVPSRHDGWGLVVPEGLAAGMPVISTHQTGAAVELIRPEANGWLIPPGDEEMLYRAMSEAASSSEAKLSEMSARARESVSGHSLENGARRFVEAACAAVRESSLVGAGKAPTVSH
jgi:glycosyltransferase involved in cell wall biosynthesis